VANVKPHIGIFPKKKGREMANRRMFSKTITSSSRFLMMPQSTQNLYFQLGMNADDDGFCEHFTIMRMTDSKPDDLSILQAKGFVKVFDDKVLIIKDWKENNYLRNDRYTASKYLKIYKNELERLSSGIPDGIPVVDGRYPQDRLGKDRIGKNKSTPQNNSNNKKKENPIGSYSYLENVPQKDVEEMAQKFSLTSEQIVKEAESCLDWLKAKGIKRKDYKAQLRNWLRKSKDFKLNNQPADRFSGFIKA